MKTVIPWVLVVALLAGVYFLYSDGKQKDTRLAAAQADAGELAALRTEVETLRKVAIQTNEIARLRKDSEDLLRLRSEVNQLRNAGSQLSNQLQAAQVQSAKIQQQQQALTQQMQQQAASLQAAQAQAQAQAQQWTISGQTNLGQQLQGFIPSQPGLAQPQTAGQAQAACINNLRQIDGAKQHWALENKKPANSVPTVADLATYLPGGVFNLACPAGGSYNINPLTTAPTCSIPGHALQ